MQKYPCILADPVDSKSDWEIGITLVHFATAVNEKKKKKKKAYFIKCWWTVGHMSNGY